MLAHTVSRFGIKCAMLVSVFLFITACTTDYTAQVVNRGISKTGLLASVVIERQHPAVLHTSSGLLISRTASNYSTRLNGQVARRLSEALQQNFVRVELAEGLPSLEEAFLLAEDNRLSYLFVPRPVYYDDNAASLQELGRHLPDPKERGADKFYIQVALYDVVSRQVVDVAVIKAASGFFSQAAMPEALLVDAFDQYRAQLTSQYSARF